MDKDELEQLFQYDPEELPEILATLRAYPFMVPHLRQAREQIRRYFYNPLCIIEPAHFERKIIVYPLLHPCFEVEDAHELDEDFLHGYWLDALSSRIDIFNKLHDVLGICLGFG